MNLINKFNELKIKRLIKDINPYYFDYYQKNVIHFEHFTLKYQSNEYSIYIDKEKLYSFTYKDGIFTISDCTNETLELTLLIIKELISINKTLKFRKDASDKKKNEKIKNILEKYGK